MHFLKKKKLLGKGPGDQAKQKILTFSWSLDFPLLSITGESGRGPIASCMSTITQSKSRMVKSQGVIMTH